MEKTTLKNPTPLKEPTAKSQDFRLFLQEELLKRCKKNPSYSLRAFAKVLQSDSSTLAKLLKGTRPMGRITISRFCERLGLDPENTQRFVEFQKSKTKASSNQRTPSEVLPDYQQLTLDSFKVISDWYHFAILELMRTTNFNPSFPAISKTLGISVNEARIAVERLCRIGVLEIQENGEWKDLSDGTSTTVGTPFTTSAFRNLQKQILKKAIDALDEIPIEIRDQSSITFAIPQEKIGLAKEKIKNFRRDMDQELGSAPNPDRVYHLSISFYPVSHLNEDVSPSQKIKTKRRKK